MLNPIQFPGRRSVPVGLAMLAALAIAFGVWAADHDEAPAISGDQSADIADVYVFRSPEDADRVVLAMTLSDVLPPGEIELGRSIFDPRVLYEFNIDSNGDAREDLVVQAFVTGNSRNQVLHVVGPVAPSEMGARSAIVNGRKAATVRVSTGSEPIVREHKGLKVFAGVRDDPFFFDFGRFVEILGGQAASFNDPGTDSFAGLNVYAIVVEMPLSRLGNPGDLTVWGTTSR